MVSFIATDVPTSPFLLPTPQLEWYDPKQSTTKGGKLVQTLERRPINDLDYAGGSIQVRE